MQKTSPERATWLSNEPDGHRRSARKQEVRTNHTSKRTRARSRQQQDLQQENGKAENGLRTAMVPGAHVTHACCAVRLATVPAAQGKQALPPLRGWYVPANSTARIVMKKANSCGRTRQRRTAHYATKRASQRTGHTDTARNSRKPPHGPAQRKTARIGGANAVAHLRRSRRTSAIPSRHWCAPRGTALRTAAHTHNQQTGEKGE